MSKKIWYSLMAVFVIAAFVLSACGTTTPTATQPTQQVAPTGGKVGVVLPTKDERRWLQDQAVFQKAGWEPLFSQGDSAKEKANDRIVINAPPWYAARFPGRHSVIASHYRTAELPFVQLPVR